MHTDQNGKVREYTASDFVSVGEDTYVIYSDPITPVNFDTRHTVELLLDGEVVHTVEYGISAYVYYIQHQSTPMADLARALYNFGRSAVTYKNSVR